MRICVVGLGRIGLPLAVQYATKGHHVVGADVNPETVELVNRGEAPFPGEAHLPELLQQTAGAGLLRATVDTSVAVAESDAVVIVVPLFVDDEAQPDFGWMDEATKAVAREVFHGRAQTLRDLPARRLRDRRRNRRGWQRGIDRRPEGWTGVC